MLKLGGFDYVEERDAPTSVGSTTRSVVESGLKFFGFDQVVFASDAPFDPEGGSMYIRETIKILDTLEIDDRDRRKLYQDNAERLFNRRFT